MLAIYFMMKGVMPIEHRSGGGGEQSQIRR